MKFKSDIQAESKVGIGTATVNYPLDVRAGSANSDIAQFTGANDSRGLKISTFQTLAADDSVDYDCQYNGDAPIVPFGAQTWSMSGSEKMRLKQDGNLGIGTTSPITKLEVSSSAQTKLRITSTDTSVLAGESIGRVEFKSNDASTGGNNVMGFVDCLATNAGSTYALTFGTGNAAAAAEKMRILPNGDVGIGTISPNRLLTVETTGNACYLALNSSSNNTTIGSDVNGCFVVYDDSSSTYRMVIDQTTGNVGIGTTNPLFKLDLGVNAVNLNTATNKQIVLNVNGGYTGQATDQYKVIGYTGSIASNTDIFTQTSGENLKNFYTGVFGGAFFNSSKWGLVQGGSTRFCVLGGTAASGAGNVGIGTTSPGDKLVVQGDGDGILVRSNDFTLSRIIPRGQTSTNWDKALFSLYNAAAENVRIDTAGSSWFNGGNVGINDTTPSYKLDVNGEGRFTGDLRCLSLIQTSQSDKKEFISDIVKTTNKKIEFKEYVYKSDSGNRKRYGVLAEDIEVDYPELVHIDADGVKGVNYIDLLVKRVAELEKELEDISLTEGPKGDTGSRGLRGYTGTSGSSGTNGADGKDGNSHLSDVSSIGFNEKSGQLEIQIGRETYRFNQDK